MVLRVDDLLRKRHFAPQSSYMMAALDFSLAQHKQIVIAVLPGGRNP